MHLCSNTLLQFTNSVHVSLWIKSLQKNPNQMSFAKGEEKKDNIFVSFTTDAEGFEKIKGLIKTFMTEVQKVAVDGKHTGLYQLNVDLLEIFNLR